MELVPSHVADSHGTIRHQGQWSLREVLPLNALSKQRDAYVRHTPPVQICCLKGPKPQAFFHLQQVPLTQEVQYCPWSHK